MRKILVCGSRTFKNRQMILLAMWDQYHIGKYELIHGDADGADSIAKKIAIENNITEHSYPAEWNKYGRRAGPIRNIQMLEMKPDLVLAFFDKVISKGTNHTVTEAKKRGIPVKIFGLVNKK